MDSSKEAVIQGDQIKYTATHLLLLDKVQIEHRQLLLFDHVFHLQHLHRLDLDEFMGTQRLATPLALLDARREGTKAPAWKSGQGTGDQ